MDISARFLAFTTYGVQWVLWLLIALSVISVGIMLERLWHYTTYRPKASQLAALIRKLLAAMPALPEGSEEARKAEAYEAAVDGAKSQERLELERNLAFLGTLGSNAPFIGLFGTVLGIIKAFHDLAGNQAGGPAVVMAGISEALVATAVGLMVAIPAVVAYNYFNRRVKTAMTQVDWMINLALISIKAGAERAADPADISKPASWRSRVLLLAAVGGAGLVVGFLAHGRDGRGTPAAMPALPAPSGSAETKPLLPTPPALPTAPTPAPQPDPALIGPPASLAPIAPAAAGPAGAAPAPVGMPAPAAAGTAPSQPAQPAQPAPAPAPATAATPAVSAPAPAPVAPAVTPPAAPAAKPPATPPVAGAPSAAPKPTGQPAWKKPLWKGKKRKGPPGSPPAGAPTPAASDQAAPAAAPPAKTDAPAPAPADTGTP